MKRYEIEMLEKNKWHLHYGPFDCQDLPVAAMLCEELRREYPNDKFRIIEIVETRTVIKGEKE